MRVCHIIPAMLLALAGCGDDASSSESPDANDTSTTTSATPRETGTTAASATEVLPLPDGILSPGRYRHVVSVEWCKEVKDDPIACPEDVPLPPPIPVVVTVPSDGWFGSTEFSLIAPTGDGTEGPSGAALVMGWTSHAVGVQSDPCLSKNHQTPDVRVGQGVDDFVEAVAAQPWFDFPAPTRTKLGGATGRFFTLEGPADLSQCEEWRPWDPGFYAQGPKNIWEVWVLDVRGHRVVIVAQHFPGTPEETVTELHAMVESIRFPSK